jgi:deoxycytidylate deaminase
MRLSDIMTNSIDSDCTRYIKDNMRSKINPLYLSSFTAVDSSYRNPANTLLIKMSNMLHTAISLSRNATCARHHIGALVVDNDMKILSSGWNGVKSGELHCKEMIKVIGYENHHEWSLRNEIHAEVNALTPFISKTNYIGLFVSSSPCKHCVDFILKNFTFSMNNQVFSRIKFITFAHPYDDYEDNVARLINESQGEIKVIQFIDEFLREEINRFAPVENRYPRILIP